MAKNPKGSKSPLRARILAVPDIEKHAETVPEWTDENGPMTVEIRGLTGESLMEIIQAARTTSFTPDGEEVSKTDQSTLAKTLLIKTLFDPELNEPIFEDADADALWQKSGAVLNRLAEISMKVNGLAQKEAKEIEKN